MEEQKEVDGRELGVNRSPTPLPPQTKNPGITNLFEIEQLFLDFIASVTIQSKDLGRILLKEYIYAAQKRLLGGLFEALRSGKHHIVVLKARQLGISTIMLAFDIFWLALHPGLQGALITDTAGNLAKFRVIINQMLKGLPARFKLKFDQSNREMLVYSNGSCLDYVVAGIKNKGTGKAVTLGTSRAYNYVHGTECSNWADYNGYASLMASLSEHHPDRLFIFESTARGFNLFHEMWTSAKDDPETQTCVFIGWWAKESYSVPEGGDIFLRYWDGELTPEEEEKADICKRLYGVEISPQQWAWYRWKSQTRMGTDGTMESEYPFHELEAFVATGKGFFPAKKVSGDLKAILEGTNPCPFEGYAYRVGDEFIKTQVEVVKTIPDAALRIWESPNDNGNYVFGVDVAYGRTEEGDRSVVQIFRCYADKMIQVAEYASTVTETHHLAWVICHLAGNYKNCLINMEITGPGYAVKQELDHLKIMLNNGYLDRNFIAQPGMRDFFNKAKYYLFHRPDQMGSGYCYFWKTSEENKQTIFNQYRDQLMTGALELKSRRLLEEMQHIKQEGFRIEGSGRHRDDLCMATALAVKGWLEWIRKPLIDLKKTQANVIKSEENAKKPGRGFVGNIYEHYMSQQKEFRQKEAIRQAWEEDGDLGFEDAGMDVTYEPSYDDGEDLYG